MLKIRHYEKDTNRESWNAYVTGHTEGTVFHLVQWKNVIEKTFGHKSLYLIAEETDGATGSGSAIVGIFPLFIIRSFLFGRYLVSTPFAEIGGPLGNDEPIEKELVDYGISYTKEQKMDYLELRNGNEKGLELPRKELYYNFKREIFENVEDNMNAIPRKSRRMVRQSEKNNLSFEFGVHNLSRFYQLLARNYHRLGTPIFTFELFNNFCREFAEKCNILLIFNEQHQPVAGVLFFLFKDQVLPYYAGSLAEYQHLATNDFMYWQLMKYGCEQGYKVFDFGRSKAETGSFHFKRHWGFEPKPLSYQYYLNTLSELPDLSPANPKYKKKIALWQSLPFGATKLLGPIIAKHLT